MTNTTPMLLNIREAAKTLGVSERTVWAISAPRGPLACVKIGARVMYRPADLEAYIAAQTVSAES